MESSIEYFQFVKIAGNEQEDDYARSMNNDMLRKGFVGVGVIENATYKENVPKEIRKILGSRLMADERIGTIEAYENGGYNIFVRVYKDSTYYLDGFFKVFIEKED